ncbi:MAG: hypothetical protein JXR73_19920 [Candidatus Omnitrophica bacterium]|nr:hypothetical protein [Candidatus Omnitrophota bacterium]
MIESVRFGQITIDGKTYDHDVIIDMEGNVEKRKKKLSKKIYGTSHVVSVDEVKYFLNENAESLIIGAGQQGILTLSPEAREYLQNLKIRVQIAPTPQAILLFNEAKEKKIGLFHVTC